MTLRLHFALVCVGVVGSLAPSVWAGPSSAPTPVHNAVSLLNDNAAQTIVQNARERTYVYVKYDPKYVGLDYPWGDVDPDTGVCTDVIIRTYRTAFGFDFQKAVHEDMRRNFSAYPKRWGLKRPDKNIDHRRVPNLERFLERRGAALPVTLKAENYKPGDLVTWRLGGFLPHIGVVSDRTTAAGVPLIIHNIGQGPVEDDLLFHTDIEGHYRFVPDVSERDYDILSVKLEAQDVPQNSPISLDEVEFVDAIPDTPAQSQTSVTSLSALN